MTDNSFELPWSADNPLHFGNIPENPVIDEIICQLENFLRQREKLSCPTDEIDTRILSVIRYAMDSVKSLMEQNLASLTDIQKQFLINKCRLFIKDAIKIVEKTLKIQST
ncbi:PREDICTED: uncharacterized protein LOC107164254 [Diuraphis noxia]|uniref:uncharacterized protein LOC107164254 n=1 Tax=Diuraphis noxia TaxID=143948 RepID=UPI0007635FD9|nr:PREDICTED: uncharacterized protein LOC107164254 [Diuraphis noxia]